MVWSQRSPVSLGLINPVPHLRPGKDVHARRDGQPADSDGAGHGERDSFRFVDF